MNMKKLFLNKYAPTLCLAAWIVLNFLKNNFVLISIWSELIIIFLISAGVLLIGLKVISGVFRIKAHQAIPILFVLVIFILTYNHLYSFFKQFFDSLFDIQIYKPWRIWRVVIIVTVVLAWQTSKYTYKFFQILISTLPLIVCFQLFPAIYNKLYEDNTSVNIAISANEEKYIFKYKPNIYFFLLDAYGRADMLKHYFNFNNYPFIKALKDRNFIIGTNAHSNYNCTHESLAATFNMTATNISKYKSPSIKGNHLVKKILKKNNYTTIKLPPPYVQSGCYGNQDICFKSWTKYLNLLTYFLKHSFWSDRIKHTDFNEYISISDLRRSILLPNAPKFVFAHFAHVHDAIYDIHGNFHSKIHQVESPSRYLSSIKKVNGMLLEVIDEIKHKDPDSIIILQSDHGFDNVDFGNVADSTKKVCGGSFKYRFEILSAILLPKYMKDRYIENYFTNGAVTNSLFKVIFTKLSGLPPAKLEPTTRFCCY